MQSERLNRKGKGRVVEGDVDGNRMESDEEEVEFDQAPSDDEEEEVVGQTESSAVPPPLAFSTPSASSSANTNQYVPNTRRPQALSSASYPTRPTNPTTPTARRLNQPAPDAKGRQRQPRMGDKMDSLLGKIRKRMG